MASVEDLEAAGPKPSRRYATNRSSSTKKGGELRINLKMVSEALIDEGLDPTVEIIRILKSEVPVRDANGNLIVAGDKTYASLGALHDDVKAIADVLSDAVTRPVPIHGP